MSDQCTIISYRELNELNERIASLSAELAALKEQLESQTTEIFQFHAIREILKRHGCTSDEDVVHVPHLVETFLRRLKEQLRIARETLEGIRDHEHCNCDAVTGLSGHAHGHRCASNLAAEGLEKMGGKG